ncbi:hypothetical protein ACWEGE_13265 [Amycolatopsis sp. NPDC004747]
MNGNPLWPEHSAPADVTAIEALPPAGLGRPALRAGATRRHAVGRRLAGAA